MSNEECKIVGVNDELIAGDSQRAAFEQVIPRDIIVISLVMNTGLLADRIPTGPRNPSGYRS
jgi:hypothetical protein